MKKLSFTLFAILAASISLSSPAAETVAPAARTASLLESGADVQVRQITVVVDPNRVQPAPYYNGAYQDNGYRHHRQYRTVRVVRYRHGVRYVSYRRVYYR